MAQKLWQGLFWFGQAGVWFGNLRMSLAKGLFGILAGPIPDSQQLAWGFSRTSYYRTIYLNNLDILQEHSLNISFK